MRPKGAYFAHDERENPYQPKQGNYFQPYPKQVLHLIKQWLEAPVSEK
jgi:hypothetical protein